MLMGSHSAKPGIMCVFGTRPEAYKMLPLVLDLKKDKRFKTSICVTAQHRELLDQALAPFGVQPDRDLNIMAPGQTPSDVTCRALKGLEDVLEQDKPDLVLVHGDTTTAFAAALAAFYAKTPVGHVEAGLRSFDKYRPYPEEINRKLVSSIADLHFAPTQVAKHNLVKEGVHEPSIFVTGNTAIDFIRYTIRDDHCFTEPALGELDFNKPVVVMTAHRRENFGQPLQDIFAAALRLVHEFEDLTLVYSMHPNPGIKDAAQMALSGHPRIQLLHPWDIVDMHNLLKRSTLLLTDSGGLQEEAPAFDLPTVVLRDVTERPEGIDAGTMVLAGTNTEDVYNAAKHLLTDPVAYSQMAQAPNPFGDGYASHRIIEAISEHFSV